MIVEDCHPDSKWKKIQQNTFTRWVNQKLRPVNIEVTDLETDFEEGLKLIRLVEVLSGRSLGRYSKKVTFRHQKLENISLALKFLESEEHIKLINIDSSAIADRNLKLILGLVWTLILHYSISKQIWDGHESGEMEAVSPKLKLMTWLKGKLPVGVPFTNFTSDWNDGILLGALVDSCAPELKIDWQNWLPSHSLQSTRTAMQLASDYLNIAPLITPEELINPAVDEKSVMTYLSQFPGAKYTRRWSRFYDIDMMPIVGTETKLLLYMCDMGMIPEAVIRAPDGSLLQNTQHQLSDHMYEIKYLPKIIGEHEIILKTYDNNTANKPAPISVKVVAVEGAQLLYDKIAKLGEEVKFCVGNVKVDPIEIKVVTPFNKEIMVPVVIDGDTYKGQFTPKHEGLYRVKVFQKGNSIIGSPFPLTVIGQAQIKIWGKGIGPEDVEVGKEVMVYADYSDSFLKHPQIHVYGPSGTRLTVTEIDLEDSHEKIFKYIPKEIGTHKVIVFNADETVEISQYTVMVTRAISVDERAFGPGLESGVANIPCIFLIRTNECNSSQIDVAVSPTSLLPESDAKKPNVELSDNIEGVVTARFTPEESGIYTVKVCIAGEQIKGSPFVVEVKPANESLEVADMQLSGIKPNLIALKGQNVTFMIDVTIAGIKYIELSPFKPVVNVLDESYQNLHFKMMEISPGKYECSFVPEAPGRYYILASVGGVAVPGSPLMVFIRELINASEIRVFGEGVQPVVHPNQSTYFIIDPQSGADIEKFRAEIRASETVANIPLVGNGSQKLTAKYIAPNVGPFEIAVYYDDIKLLKMVINVKSIDVSSILVDGLDGEVVPLGIRKNIAIDAGVMASLDNDVEVIAEEESGSKYVIPLERALGSTVYRGCWTARVVGVTKFSVFFNGNLVREFRSITEQFQDVTKCRAFGSGLRNGTVGLPAEFQIDTQAAGKGKIKVAIIGPSESVTRVIEQSDGLCTVEYIAQAPGLYDINISFGDKEEPIPGSPFMALVDYEYNPSKVLITGYNNGRARAGVPVSITVDATHTALEPISARLPFGFNQPIVEQIKARVYRVTFTPNAEFGKILPLEVLYGGQLLHGRALDFTVEPDHYLEPVILKNCSGKSLRSTVRASFQYDLLIDITGAEDINKLFVEIKGPDDRLRKSVRTETSDKGVYLLGFVPDMAGTYHFVVYANGRALHSKPYELIAVPVGSAEKCFMESKPSETVWIIGEQKTFTINTSRGGEGVLNIVSDDEEMEMSIEKQEHDMYVVKVTPHSEGYHQVLFIYGGCCISNGIFNFKCVTSMDEDAKALKRISEIQRIFPDPESRLMPRSFRFSVASQYQFEKLNASVKMPSGETDIPLLTDDGSGSITVTYQPKEYGNHLLSVQHDGINMLGSPVAFYVSEAADGCVTVYGPGLSQAIVGEPAPFTVCAKGSPAKDLAIAVEGFAKATINCHDNKDGTCSVTWIPPAPGEYKVHIKLCDKPVKGSPFTVYVAGESQERAQVSIHSTSEVSLNIVTDEIKSFSASVKSPHGIEEPCFIRQIDNDHIGVSFTPREEGEHLITVKRNGQLIPKSPFRIEIDEGQVGDASKVVVKGVGKAVAVCHQYNEIVVDTRSAGYGGLLISVEGPVKAELKCNEVKKGLFKIAYKPNEPGLYIISIMFADVHVNGSPFTVNCGGKGVSVVKESVYKFVKEAPIILPEQVAELYLQLENTSLAEITAKVRDPNGHEKDVEVFGRDNNFYKVKFKPEMDGPHAVSVFWKEQHILGSPFLFTVGHMTEMGAHRVRVAGIGLQRAETNKKQSFNIYTREAGPGELEVMVEGPSKADVHFYEHKDGSCHLDYKVATPGEYLIFVKFNNQDVPDSPFKVFIVPSSEEVGMLELISFPQYGVLGKECGFTILTHNAMGYLEGKLQTPSGKTEIMDIVSILEGESYELEFTPTEIGNYYIDVTLDGVPMRCSPFRLPVGVSIDDDPTAITVTGNGIYGGQSGKKCEFMVITDNAGTGPLQIQIDGPSKVTLDLDQVDQGYKVCYTALAPGVYYAAIKYAGVHIFGSPFKLVLTEEPGDGGRNQSYTRVPILKGDAGKVTVNGAGLNKFVPGQPTVFNIDTGLAGENLLFVGVVTSKGPCEEVAVRHLGGGQFVVTYLVQERVTGFIFIKYGDVNVPGSPFSISF